MKAADIPRDQTPALPPFRGRAEGRPLPAWVDRDAFESQTGRLEVPEPPPLTKRDVVPPPHPGPRASMCAPLRNYVAVRNATQRDIERLVPLAQELAEREGLRGVTAGDIRALAVQRGVLTGQETGRQLSYLSRVPIAAGLVRSDGQRRTVDRDLFPQSHGNDHVVYLHPKFAR